MVRFVRLFLEGCKAFNSPALSRGELGADGCHKDSDNSYFPAGVGGHPRLQSEIAQGPHRAVPNTWPESLKNKQRPAESNRATGVLINPFSV